MAGTQPQLSQVLFNHRHRNQQRAWASLDCLSKTITAIKTSITIKEARENPNRSTSSITKTRIRNLKKLSPPIESLQALLKACLPSTSRLIITLQKSKNNKEITLQIRTWTNLSKWWQPNQTPLKETKFQLSISLQHQFLMNAIISNELFHYSKRNLRWIICSRSLHPPNGHPHRLGTSIRSSTALIRRTQTSRES